MQSAHSFCARFYRWAEQTNSGGQARVDLRATRLRFQGRLFERKNISVPENALITLDTFAKGLSGGVTCDVIARLIASFCSIKAKRIRQLI
jgi:hypothetical protein